MMKRTLSVVGMFTPEKAEEVESAIRDTLKTAVMEVSTDPQNQTVTVSYDENKIAIDDVKDAIIVHGYVPEP